MQMKTGVEQSVYAILILNMLPDKAVLPGEAISQQLGASPTYFQKLLRKLVSANLITSVPGVKGGFKLRKKAEDIRIYDIYLAIEGQQSLYSSSGVMHGMLDLEEEGCCLLTDLMQEAESSWQTVLKRQTIASLYEEINVGYQPKVQLLQQWIKEKMVM
ncbi:RrF2 family transcriptional regulator [Paenibacillus agilis]|uniref:Rrf2 family transcriptional regulator n=1 Tax=Paenibacillus agilis TaxID=3020863 RepID=A0A559IXL2_9BACL|nr:Rrf2 family transcriptional regulator [Paenibacillus agilis]TVX92375.1 Rrf2 family transcriptional regulator [Paenibacillus agilis]